MKTKVKGWHQAALAAAVGCWLAAGQALAGVSGLPADLVSARSQSGQFVVYAGPSSGSLPPVLALAKHEGFVQLEPRLVAVSCERMKQILLRELGATDPWRGTIYVVLRPARGAGDTITITSDRFKNNWQYRVEMPDVVEPSRYVRAVVQTLLVEMANRTARARAAEVPTWLVEGFSQMLLASSEAEIILPPPRAGGGGVNLSITQVKGRKESLAQQVQKKLRGRTPVTFDELSWPTEEQLSGDAGDVYSGSAHLFVGELLRLPQGRAGLCAMLASLSQYYNWQVAFLKAFHSTFERPLDVEKWWALSRAQAGGQDAAPTWSREDSWQKLEQALHAAVKVRTGTNELPLHADVPLQTVIREWETVRQTQALNDSLRALELLRLRSAQEFPGLAQDYQQVIKTYLQQRDHSGAVLPLARKASRRRAMEAACRQLDVLDARRQAMRTSPKAPDAAEPPAVPAAPSQN